MNADRPFAPTRERLRKAAREGDLPRSSDLTSLAAFAAGSLALALLFTPMDAAAVAALRDASGGRIEGGPYALLCALVAALCAAAAAGAIGMAIAQAGRIVFVLPSLKVARLNPVPGFKRLASRETAIAALKAIVAAVAIVVALAPVARDIVAAATGGADSLASVALVANALPRLALALGAIGAIFAGADLALQHANRRKRLRMTLQEYKDDVKAGEGNPQLRSRRRTAHGALLRGSVNRLREAAFVVVNPDHIAVALEYEPPRVEVPRVLLRAYDDAALEVKRRAAELGIPVIEDVELARALDAQTRVGDFIPRDLYGPVARIVAELTRALAA